MHHDTMVSWCRDTVVSPLEGGNHPGQKAHLPVFIVIGHDEVDGDPGDLILAGDDVFASKGIDDPGQRPLLLDREVVGGRFLADLLDRFSDLPDRGVMIP